MTQELKRSSASIGTLIKYIEGQAAALDGAIYGKEHARKRMPLPEEYEGEMNLPFKKVLPQVFRLGKSILGSYLYLKRPVKARKSIATPEFLGQLESFAVQKGATAIGYAQITPDLIFKDFVIPHQYAIVIISEMRKEQFETAPSLDSMTEIGKAYTDTTIIANKMTGYLRKHGFSAYPGISMGGSVDHTRLAQKAGLGKIGYHGSLISPQQGARVRINVVYTNIENLPFPETNEHDWVLDFCAMCKKCIRKCPPHAIRTDPLPDADGRISAIDNTKCGPYMAQNHGCGVCIAICPFSMAGYEKIQTNFKSSKSKNAIGEKHA